MLGFLIKCTCTTPCLPLPSTKNLNFKWSVPHLSVSSVLLIKRFFAYRLNELSPYAAI